MKTRIATLSIPLFIIVLLGTINTNAQTDQITNKQLSKLWILTEYNNNGKIQKITGDSRNMILKPNGTFDSFCDPIDGKGNWIVEGDVIIMLHNITKLKQGCVNCNTEFLKKAIQATAILKIVEHRRDFLKLKYISLNGYFMGQQINNEFNFTMTFKSY